MTDLYFLAFLYSSIILSREIGNNLNLSGTIPSTISALTRITSMCVYFRSIELTR